MVICDCREYREMVISPKGALEDLVKAASIPLTEYQKEQLEAKRPRGICPRCHGEHHLDPLGIAVHCMAVQQVSFNADGGIGHIEFVVGQRYDLTDDLKSLNVQLDKLKQRIDTFDSFIRSQVSESLCVCGHGLSRHSTDDGCSECHCRTFRPF